MPSTDRTSSRGDDSEQNLAALAKERDFALAEAEKLAVEFEQVRMELDTVRAERDELQDDTIRLAEERDESLDAAQREAAEAAEEHDLALAELRDELESRLADVARERDDAVTAAAAAEDEIDALRLEIEARIADRDEAERRYDGAVDELTETQSEMSRMAQEFQRGMELADKQAATLEEDHHRTRAEMLEAHERQMIELAAKLDAAVEEAERTAAEREAERDALDEQLAKTKLEAEAAATQLQAERDAALEEIGQLANDWEAATEVAERLNQEHAQAVTRSEVEAAKRTENQDEFIAELLEDHEKDVARLAAQREEAQRQADGLEQQIAEGRLEAERLAAALEQEREQAAELAAQREAEAQKVDRLAEEREAEMRQAAKVAAEQDDFLADLLEGHDRELAGLRRERDYAREQAKAAIRELADLKITVMRLQTAQRQAERKGD